ncbi:hypothetical protein EON65_00555 [archaeon]|nr:MAG: hypothetical protein EON65_00555 [archaeon]
MALPYLGMCVDYASYLHHFLTLICHFRGLYDSKMGPMDQKVYCGTCRSNVATCPGHPGHIELDLPVYYPLYFGELVRLLRSKCLFCHK